MEEKIPMGILKNLLIYSLMVSATHAVTMHQIFDFPLGHSPMIESTQINGLIEHKITYRTQTPLPLIREYYRGLLEDSAWEELQFGGLKQMMPPSWKKHLPVDFIDSQQIWLKEDLILHCFFVAANPESFFSISLKFIDTAKKEAKEASLPVIAGSKLLLNYSHTLDHFASQFIVFETSEPKDYLMKTVARYFKQEKKLEDNPIMAEYLKNISPFLKKKEWFQSVQLYMDQNQNWILFFCGDDIKTNKRMFGFFKKEIGNTIHIRRHNG